MSRSMKKGVCVLMTLLFLFTLVLPVFAMEIETGQEPANDAAQDFIDTVKPLTGTPLSQHPTHGVLPARRGRPTRKTRS